MKLFETISAFLNAWTGSVAAAIIGGFNRVVSPRMVRLIEDDKGGFVVEAAEQPENAPSHVGFADGTLSGPNLAAMFRGNRGEIVLQPSTTVVFSVEF